MIWLQRLWRRIFHRPSKEDLALVRTIAQELPPLRYEILLDMINDGLKASEIAAKRGLTREFVEQELSEAMKHMLRGWLEDHDHE